MKISYPFVFTGYGFGIAWYPKRLEKISIYLADLSFFYGGDVTEVVKELTITILEEMSHLWSRSPKNHEDYDDVLTKIVEA